MRLWRRATVSRISQDGIGYIIDVETKRVFVFTFDQISRQLYELKAPVHLQNAMRMGRSRE
jgi:hypothetical protein